MGPQIRLGSRTASDVISGLEQAEGQIYSFVFNGDPADPTNIEHASPFIRRPKRRLCGRYSHGVPSTMDDFWFLEFDLSQSVAGTYQVVYEATEMRDPAHPAATVRLLHRQDTYVANYLAVEGQITLDDGANTRQVEGRSRSERKHRRSVSRAFGTDREVRRGQRGRRSWLFQRLFVCRCQRHSQPV